MADYEPFPTNSAEPEDNRTLRRGVLGCFGCGGAGILGIVAVLVLLFGGLALGTNGCDIDLQKDPGDGKASRRLPITVSPTTGLRDGQPVRITSDAFAASSFVVVTMCLRTADTRHGGVADCDQTIGSRYATDSRAHLAI